MTDNAEFASFHKDHCAVNTEPQIVLCQNRHGVLKVLKKNRNLNIEKLPLTGSYGEIVFLPES